MSITTRTEWEIGIERRVDRIQGAVETWTETTNRCPCCRRTGRTAFHGHVVRGREVQTTVTVHAEGCDYIALLDLIAQRDGAVEGSGHEALVYRLLDIFAGRVSAALDRAMFL